MKFYQYYLGCLAHASYMVADEKTRIAAVIDPQRDIDQYLEDATHDGLKIDYVFLTHFHADFLAGHIELREQTGAQIYLGARAQAGYEFVPLKDGDRVEFGDVRLEAMETPGHTPEGISILLYDRAVSDAEPQAVFTGDTLFIGDVGRPDLLASIGVTADELASMLYDSIHKKLLMLPDQTRVYPAHGAGSLCGKQLSTEKVSTIGEQRTYNYALQPMSEEAFSAMVTADQPEAPAYFVHDAILNRQDRPGLDESIRESMKPLTLETALRLADDGGQLLDVREPADFAGAHLAGSINIGLRGKYATWAGTILNREQPIVVIAEPGSEGEAIMRLGRIGFDHVAGYLKDGMSALQKHPSLIRQTDRVTAQALANQLDRADGSAPLIVDVRTPDEWQAGHIPDSLNLPLNRIADRVHELPLDRQLTVHCASGYRSSMAISLFLKKGYRRVSDLVGGYDAWKNSGLPISDDPVTSSDDRVTG